MVLCPRNFISGGGTQKTPGVQTNNKVDNSLARRSRSVTSFVSALKTSETGQGLVLAVIVGVVAALGAVAFRWLIESFRSLFFGGGSEALSFLGDYYVIVIPAAGGLLVGPLIYFFAREAKGHGVPEVMEAVALRGGRIRPPRGCRQVARVVAVYRERRFRRA